MKSVYKDIKQVDILAIGVHPDDIELACSGTLLKHIALGASVGLLDLTEGELGTRGNATTRLKESAAGAECLEVDFRVNIGIGDGFFRNDAENQLQIIEIIRRCRPSIILGNSIEDRHPDHGRAAQLVADSFFYSGLRKIKTSSPEYRADVLYHYIQDRHLTPDFCIDVTAYAETKKKSIECYATQFFTTSEITDDEPSTPISSQDFMEYVMANMRVFGRPIQATYAEGFKVNRTLGVNDLRNMS